MRARRVPAGIAAAGLVLGLGLAGASPASAAAGVVDNGNGTATVDLTGLIQGTAIVICAPSVAVVDCRSTNPGFANVLYYRIGDTGVVVIEVGLHVSGDDVPAGLPAGRYTIGLDESTGDSQVGGLQDVRIGPPSASIVDAHPIPAWVQAYGRLGEDDSCLNGWGPSWQPWAEEITGGRVCTRSIPSLG